jgi:peptidoglycan/xylan/chitin deacetylase (PgdA/CDA1 family)
LDSCLVLIYHRVTELENDPFQLAVTPDKFKTQIECLKRYKQVLSLQEFLNKIKRNDPLANCALITFDDGYLDNLHRAKPILENLKVPAVFFITAGMINQNREFWWDELENIFFSANSLPNCHPFYSRRKKFLRALTESENRQAAFLELHQIFKYMPRGKREKILNDLFNLAGLDRNKVRSTHRIMNPDEIKTLSCTSQFEIGSHSMCHDAFKSLSQLSLIHEIDESKKILELIIGKPVTSFCYPFGLKRDIKRRAIQCVMKSGYSCAFTNIPGTFFPQDNLFLIPRILVRDWEPLEFEEKLLSVQFLH